MKGINLGPEAWARLDELLQAALEVPARDRSAWIGGLGPEDRQLQPALRSLLARAVDIEADEFLERGALVNSFVEPDTIETLAPGATVGVYRLLERIGAGGMADVWLAERRDGLLDRPVALKLPHVSGLGASFTERLVRERSILASLTHANIARLYDAGVTDEGRPFIALEYVEGLALDAYCDNHRLNTRARIELFLQVARAVVHAHANLVLHRDLKPSNILVTADGQVKLLDFGIAALLDDGQAVAGDITRASGRVMTPDFASPEQILGHAMTIQSDVYALGVVLFVLLTGQRPYVLRRASAAALEEAIVAVEARRPSDMVVDRGVRAELRGDIDAIVLKALKKRPAERYATVEAFIDDLERHRFGYAVVAQPDTALYRAGKFVRRHKSAVILLSLTGLVMLAATAITAGQMIVAQQQRDVARDQQQRVQASNEFLSLLLEDVGTETRPLSMVELLDRGVAMLDRQYGSGQRFIGRTYLDVARRFADLTQRGREIELLARAEEFAREQRDADLLAAVLCESVDARLVIDPASADNVADMDEARRLLASSRTASIDDRVACALAEARILVFQGERPRAVARLADAKRSLERSVASSSRLAGTVMTRLGQQYMEMGEFAQALALVTENLELSRASGRDNTVGYLNLLQDKSTLLGIVGEIRESAEIRRSIMLKAAQLHPHDDVPARFQYSYAVTLLRLSKLDAALELLHTARAGAEQSDSPWLLARIDLSIGRTLARMGRAEEARQKLDAAERVLRQDPHANRVTLDNVEKARAESALANNDPGKARSYIDPVLQRLGYPADAGGPSLISTLSMAARIALHAGDYDTASRLAADMLSLAEGVARAPGASADVGRALTYRARARIAGGDRAGATADLHRAIPALTNGLGADNPERAAAALLLDGLVPTQKT